LKENPVNNNNINNSSNNIYFITWLNDIVFRAVDLQLAGHRFIFYVTDLGW